MAKKYIFGRGESDVSGRIRAGQDINYTRSLNPRARNKLHHSFIDAEKQDLRDYQARRKADLDAHHHSFLKIKKPGRKELKGLFNSIPRGLNKSRGGPLSDKKSKK